jgi:hypothetical protein
MSRPLVVTEQVVPGFPPVCGLALALDPPTGVLGAGDGLAPGWGDVVGLGDALALGVVPAWASPVSMSVLAAVRTTRADQRPMPGRRFRFKLGLLGGSGVIVATGLRQREATSLCNM